LVTIWLPFIVTTRVLKLLYTNTTTKRKEPFKIFLRNKDIRKIKGSIPLWAIAEELGIHENTLYRKLRKELKENEKKEIIKVIRYLQTSSKED